MTVDRVDPDLVATFWSRLLGRERSEEMDGDGWRPSAAMADPEGHEFWLVELHD